VSINKFKQVRSANQISSHYMLEWHLWSKVPLLQQQNQVF